MDPNWIRVLPSLPVESSAKKADTWLDNVMLNPRSMDHMLGIAAGVLGSVAIFTLHKWFKEKRDEIRRAGDELHGQRYGTQSEATHVHGGSCHCRRVRFRVRAGTGLRGVDIKSKIRFPRVTIPIENFEALTDDTMMSHYAVKSGGSIGIYTFCSFCGVHVVFAPSIDPTEVQVNMDCIERAHVLDETVTYMTAAEAAPCSANSDAARQINRKGQGFVNAHKTMPREDSPAQPALTGMVGLLPDSPESIVKHTGNATSHDVDISPVDAWLEHPFKEGLSVGDYLSSIPGITAVPVGSPASKFSPPVTPGSTSGSGKKGNFAFDSPIHKQLQMHKQLQKHLKQYLEPNEIESSQI